MSQSTSPQLINVFNYIPLLPVYIDANDPLFPVLDSLDVSSLLPIIETVVVPAFDGIGPADMEEHADGWFCPPDEHKVKISRAYAVIRDIIYFGFNKVLAEDFQSNALSDERMLEVLELASEDSLLSRALHRCISYIPAFKDDNWPTRAEAFSHARTNLLYLNRLIGCLTAIVKVSLEEGIAHRWDFGADETWNAFDFLHAVSPGLIRYEAERRQMTVSDLKESFDAYLPLQGSPSVLNSPREDTPFPDLFDYAISRECPPTVTPDSSESDIDLLSLRCQPSMSREELDRMDEMFYHPDKLDFRWIDELSSGSELEVLAEYGPEELEAAEGSIVEEPTYSWSHMSDFDDLEIATATRLSHEAYRHDPLGLIGPEEYFRRLEDNVPMSFENYSGILDDEDAFYSDAESSSSDTTYSPNRNFASTGTSNSDLSLLTDDSDDEVILAMSPFGRRTRRNERTQQYGWDV
ncbi:hypothetical protein BDZ89DRAFT_1167473 [Hymenopellis radicata]|nr:hypothetical protein BDZ89DRAFT_1167473 [Hymenopellis radicata]